MKNNLSTKICHVLLHNFRNSDIFRIKAKFGKGEDKMLNKQASAKCDNLNRY